MLEKIENVPNKTVNSELVISSCDIVITWLLSDLPVIRICTVFAEILMWFIATKNIFSQCNLISQSIHIWLALKIIIANK